MEQKLKDLFERDLGFLSDKMLKEIENNSYKGTWEDIENKRIYLLIKEKIDILEAHIEYENQDDIVEVVADIANYCMMIAGNEKRKEEDGYYERLEEKHLRFLREQESEWTTGIF